MSEQRLSRQALAAWWALAAATCGFLVAFFLGPLARVIERGIVSDGRLDVAAFAEAIGSQRTGAALATTLGLGLAGSLGSLAIGVPAAYALFRLRWPGATAVRALASAPFVLPTVVVAAAFSALLGRKGLLGGLGLDQSIVGIVLALVFYNTSLVMRVVGTAWENLDPARVAVARTLGASRIRAFIHVTLPGLGPAISAAALLAFMFCASSFGIVLVLGGGTVRTLETGIYQAVNSNLDLRMAAALSLLQLLVVGGALGVSSRLQSASRGGPPTGGRDGRRLARRGDVAVIAASLAALMIVNGLPMAALIERSLRDRRGYSLRSYGALLKEPAIGVLPTSVAQAGGRSVIVACAAVAISMGLGLVITWLRLSRPRHGSAVTALAMLPLGVSSVMTGLGLLLTLNSAFGGFELHSSYWMVPLGQAIVALPFVVRVMVGAVNGLDPRIGAAASTLGAGAWRVWWRVHVPMLKAPLGVAAAFAAAMSLGEFGATAFLARPDAPTITTAIARLLTRPGADNASMAFAASVMLALVTAAIMASAERLRPRGGATW